LLESEFDAAAEFAGDVLFAIEYGADLSAKHVAIERERFDAEHAWTIDESG
jgi:hypothetical protein